LAALERMAAGENVSALSRALGVRRKLLYLWRDTVRQAGVEALRGVGRPPSGEVLTVASGRRPVVAPHGMAVPDGLTLARQQIALTALVEPAAQRRQPDAEILGNLPLRAAARLDQTYGLRLMFLPKPALQLAHRMLLFPSEELSTFPKQVPKFVAAIA